MLNEWLCESSPRSANSKLLPSSSYPPQLHSCLHFLPDVLLLSDAVRVKVKETCRLLPSAVMSAPPQSSLCSGSTRSLSLDGSLWASTLRTSVPDDTTFTKEGWDVWLIFKMCMFARIFPIKSCFILIYFYFISWNYFSSYKSNILRVNVFPQCRPSPRTRLEWFVPTLPTFQTRSAYWRSTRLTRGAFSGFRGTKEELPQGQTSFW